MSSLFSQMNFAIAAAALAVMMLGRLWFGVLFARPYAASTSSHCWPVEASDMYLQGLFI